MSIAYELAGELILKLIDPPTLTLNGSAKPWMVAPSPLLTSQSDWGVPGSSFSQTIGFAHDAACAASSPVVKAAGTAVMRPAAIATTAGTAIQRRSRPRPLRKRCLLRKERGVTTLPTM